MGTFNILTANATCPHCGKSGSFEIQFKYGDTWQYKYVIGEKLRWGGNDIGTPGLRSAVVEGIAGPCPNCGLDYLNFELLIENDCISKVVTVNHNSKG